MGKKMHCSHCKTTIGPFLKYAKNKYGEQYYYCRECQKERTREYGKTKNGRKNKLKATIKYNKKNPSKVNAWKRKYYYVKTGKIIPADNCEVCGVKIKTETHHLEYKSPANILWVCRACHKNIHKTKTSRKR